MNFNELNLRKEILRAISDMGYTEATDIQGAAIPSILEGRDVTGRSSTGTGKTAAFGIPIVQKTADNTDKASVLILSPTRELAVQITDEIRKYAKYLSNISVAAVYGGESMTNQIRMLKTARIVVGTPGRVMDHLRRKTLKLDHLQTVVLDEADEMLNMGFIDDIRCILESAPNEHQTILFSATLPPAIMKITEDFQTDTIIVKADKGQRTVSSIEQNYYLIPKERKDDALKLLLEYYRPKRALVFCNTKKMVDELSESLCESGFRAAGLHGDLKQSQRNIVMREFKSGRSGILVATDVAARGIDVDDVEAVFNYDIPQENEYYIHRIGRTGRAGKSGSSHTLVTNRKQLMQLREIERYVGMSIREKPIPTLESIAASGTAELADIIRRQVGKGIDQQYLALVSQLKEEGYSPETVAAALCERLQKKNKRLSSVQDVYPLVLGREKESRRRKPRYDNRDYGKKEFPKGFKGKKDGGHGKRRGPRFDY
ncbi:DEAD/DEAH box helicase [Qiania dongpingensis]|uniref:RNA helicase n=1 Tax=Qiania dongpingensis TaxID=2763669 RepID=A0A7G9G3Y2_9FIRM|nr:DEAD/DEAH box helicase [Qiania dongpingensis]QNM05514.1 DEAD/DEAH box helicase [Qiania dongpingensis]